MELFTVAPERRRERGRSGERDRNGCALHLAMSREAAFGRCLAPYRPRWGIEEKLEDFLLPSDGDEPLHPGTLCARFFDDRVLHVLRTVDDAFFEPASASEHFSPSEPSRFPRPDRDRTARLGVPGSGPSVGRHFRLAHWDYLGIWNHDLASDVLEVLDTSSIDVDDPDLLTAAARLGVTLT